jgi:hypothetical protein
VFQKRKSYGRIKLQTGKEKDLVWQLEMVKSNINLDSHTTHPDVNQFELILKKKNQTNFILPNLRLNNLQFN